MSSNDSELFESITDHVSGNIECDFKALLGSGGFGNVYFGKYNGEEVAIKRILVEMAEIREIKAQRKLNHENILKIFTVKEDDIFRYIVLELCAGTLRDVCEKSYKGPDLPSDVNVLYDIAKGLNYIHSTKLVHRDIKPDNILISLTTPSRIKISDFGLSKETSTNHTFELSTPLRGTWTWMAPELQQIIYRYNDQSTIQSDIPRKDSNKSDIFSAGCVYFYFVTRGIHPYGNDHLKVMQNIRNDTQIYGLIKEHFASNIIKSMITYEPNKRMSLEQVMEILDKLKEEKDSSLTSADQDFPLTSLVLKLQIRETFKEVEHSLEEKFGIKQVLSAKFHPIDPVLAFGLQERIVLLKGANHSVLFSDWEKEQEFNLKSPALLLEWNVDGTQLAVGQLDETVVVWHYPTGEILCEMKHSQRKSDLRIVWSPFSHDVLATYFWVWNSSSEEHLTYKLDSDIDDIMDVKWISKNQIACSYEKGTIDIYQVDDGANIAEFEHGEDVVWCMAWNEVQKYLATGSADSTIKIWSLTENDDPVYTLNVGSDCFSLAWRLNGNRRDSDADSNSLENPLIAGGLAVGTVFIWDLKGSAVPRYLERLSGLIRLVLFSADQRFLASCSDETGITVWSVKNWENIYTLPVEAHLPTLSWNAISNKISIGNQGQKKLRVIECVVEEEL